MVDGATPQSHRLYRMSPQDQTEVNNQIDGLLAAGRVVTSITQYGVSVLLRDNTVDPPCGRSPLLQADGPSAPSAGDPDNRFSESEVWTRVASDMQDQPDYEYFDCLGARSLRSDEPSPRTTTASYDAIPSYK